MEREHRAKEILKKCINLVQQEGIPVAEKIEKIYINDKIRSRFGSCRKENGSYYIELSGKIMPCEDRVIETVLLHELLHTCPGCMNHGFRWKKYAEIINQKYGYEITASSRYETFGMENPESREPVKYTILCTNCGNRIERRRRCPLVEKADRYRCGKCGGILKIKEKSTTSCRWKS